jgi:hypothetical protein
LGECRGEARVFSMGKEERRSGRRKREQWDWGRVREAGLGERREAARVSHCGALLLYGRGEKMDS